MCNYRAISHIFAIINDMLSSSIFELWKKTLILHHDIITYNDTNETDIDFLICYGGDGRSGRLWTR